MISVKFSGSVLLATDVAASREFYETHLGQEVELDINGINVGFKGGFTLWQKEYAHNLIFSKQIDTPKDKYDLELYFETAQIDEIFANLEIAGADFLHKIIVQPWMQRSFRVYDPDRFIVEIAESMPDVIRRLHREGMTNEEITNKSMMPKPVVDAIISEM